MNKKISVLFAVLVIFIVGGFFALIFLWGSGADVVVAPVANTESKVPEMKIDSTSVENIDQNGDDSPENLIEENFRTDDLANVKSVYKKNNATYIVVDYIEWLTGDEAIRAMREDKACVEDDEECIPPNDYYIRNKDKAVKTFRLAEGAKIIMQTYSHAENGDMNWNEEVTLAQFSEIFKRNSEAPWRYLPYHIVLQENEIVEIREQYVP